jgi:hypothetical protein
VIQPTDDIDLPLEQSQSILVVDECMLLDLCARENVRGGESKTRNRV